MTVATPEEMASWPAPNFEDPERRGGIVIGMAVPTLALVVIFTAMRFYGRGVLRHALGKDDWMMFVAAVRLAQCSPLHSSSLQVLGRCTIHCFHHLRWQHTSI
jgi:hypothetical protein